MQLASKQKRSVSHVKKPHDSLLETGVDGKSPSSCIPYFSSVSSSMSFWGFHYNCDIFFFFFAQCGSVLRAGSFVSNYSRSFQGYWNQLQFHNLILSFVVMLIDLTAGVYSLPINLNGLDKIYDLQSCWDDGMRLFWDKSHSVLKERVTLFKHIAVSFWFIFKERLLVLLDKCWNKVIGFSGF